MNKRKPGRKSAAELGVQISPLSVQRPKPPAELSDAEKATWKAVTATKPADWWRPDTHPLLISYCRHVANATRIDDLIETFNYKDIKESFNLFECLDKLLRARDRESRALVMLARAMRISQQAMILPRGAGRATANTPTGTYDPPWEPPHLS